MSEFVRQYYNEQVKKEWERLTSPYAHIEYISTIKIIEKYFPEEGHICDIGCGPGRYSIELLKRGYKVTMLDLTDNLLEHAKKKLDELNLKAEEIIREDARNLDILYSENYDGVLLMGPMYHVINKEERIAILKNVKRILKKGGVAIIAYLNAWGVTRSLMEESPNVYKNKDFIRELVKGKSYTAEESFTEVNMTIPEKGKKEIEEAGLEIISYAGCESIAAGMISKIAEIKEESPEIYNNIVELSSELCEKEPFRDMTEHIHYIVKR